MTGRHRTAFRVAAWTAVGLLGLGVTAGAAQAMGSRGDNTTVTSRAGTPTAQGDEQAPGPMAGRHPRAHRLLGAIGRTVHGEVTVKTDSGYQLVVFQRGQVQAVDAGAKTLRVKSPDGYDPGTWTVSGDTTLRKLRNTATLADVKKGDYVLVVGTRSGSTLTAKRVFDRGTEAPTYGPRRGAGPRASTGATTGA